MSRLKPEPGILDYIEVIGKHR